MALVAASLRIAGRQSHHSREQLMSTPKPKNPHAVALGRMAKSVPKNFSKAERKRRSQRMKALRQRAKNGSKND